MIILNPLQVHKKIFGKCLIFQCGKFVRFSVALSSLGFPATDFRENSTLFDSFSFKEHLLFIGSSLLIFATKLYQYCQNLLLIKKKKQSADVI